MIPGLFNIVHTENPGIAFGMLANAPGAWRDLFCSSDFPLAVLVAISLLLLLRPERTARRGWFATATRRSYWAAPSETCMIELSTGR